MADEEKTNRVIESVIHGKNDKFKKEYTFDELNLQVNVSIHYPTIREVAKIKALRAEFLFETKQSNVTQTLFETLFLLNEADEGTKVYSLDEEGNQQQEIKDYFSLDGYPRDDVILYISEDILSWMGRFRG